MSVRIGFVGAGGIAQRHLQNLAQMPEAELVAFSDVNLERAEEAAKNYGGTAYQDFMKMYETEKLDGVVITTPPFAHGDIELEACRRGLHMLVEKPVAISVEMTRPILEAVQQSGIATVVAYKYRWDDHVRKAKEMLAGRTIGLVFGNFWGGTPGAPWWRVQAQSGGQFVEQTTHIVDMARYLAGDVDEVSAYETRLVMHERMEGYDIADAATANLRFANGAIGTISNTSMVSGWGQSSLRVMAAGFTLQIAGNTLSWNGEDGEGEYQLQGDGYLGEDRAFVAALQGDRSLIYADYAEGVKSLAVSDAINRSGAAQGKAVRVADLLTV
jgi:myo-inositol 2-dehydrogenase/D-chiro-inositol 1-dehydrogenase